MSSGLRGLGICTHFGRRHHGWKVENLVPLAKEMGVTLVRDEIEWSSVEKEEGQYVIPGHDLDWLQQASDAGLGINLLLLYGNKLYDNQLDPEAFADFCSFMAKELVGKYNIVALEIWNEPTNFGFLKQYGGNWSGQEPCLWLEKFSELVTIAAARLKEEVPEIPLIIGPGEPQFFHMAERYPEAFKHIDGIAAHPYPSRFPPETVPWGGKQILERDGVSVCDDDHGYVSLWRKTQEHCREVLGRELSLHTTEWGYSTYDHHGGGHNMAGYSEPTQAKYIVRGLILNMAAGVEDLYLYDFMDDGTDRYELEQNFGMVRNEACDYDKKPSWYAISRLAGLLGMDWEFVADAPPVLEADIKQLPYNSDQWQQPVIEPHLEIDSPQFYTFRAGDDLISFLWRGGRISGEYRDPVGDVKWENAPELSGIEIIDLYTGESLPIGLESENGNVVLKEVPISGSPLAIRWSNTGVG